MTLYRSAQGKMVDMGKLAKQNELTQAVSNVKVNARGDQIGPGGKIIKRREDVVSSYYDTPPKKTAVATNIQPVVEEVVAPAPVNEPPAVIAPTKSSKKVEE